MLLLMQTLLKFLFLELPALQLHFSKYGSIIQNGNLRVLVKEHRFLILTLDHLSQITENRLGCDVLSNLASLDDTKAHSKVKISAWFLRMNVIRQRGIITEPNQ